MRTYESKSVRTPPYKVESNGWLASVWLSQARPNYMPLGDLEMDLNFGRCLCENWSLLTLWWHWGPWKSIKMTICDRYIAVQDTAISKFQFNLHDPVSYPRVWAAYIGHKRYWASTQNWWTFAFVRRFFYNAIIKAVMEIPKLTTAVAQKLTSFSVPSPVWEREWQSFPASDYTRSQACSGLAVW